MSVRVVALAAVLALVGGWTSPPAAVAVSPPSIDPSRVPPDTRPGPEQPMRQSNICAQPVTVPEPDVALPAPGFAMLNIAEAWQFSTGNGVPVAVIDTGVTPNPRLPVRAGGDYVMGGDGLSDCDAHGTAVASVIAAAPAGDGLSGVAPRATLISIRQSSRAYEPAGVWDGGEERRKAGTVLTLARAIVHAANLGAKVINISVASCLAAADPLDQGALGAAVWYAATQKDAVIVAAAGNQGENGCAPNPVFDPLDTEDPRGWDAVRTISSPSWFADYVLSVGAVDAAGAPLQQSLAGPWVGVAAPGVGIVGLSSTTGAAVNAYPPARPGERHVPFWGTSFSAAYVSGVAALVRAKYPGLSAHQVIDRIQRTAHNPSRGVDNQIGHGLIDPVAALTFDVPPGDRLAPGDQTRLLNIPPAAPPPDRRAHTVALVLTVVALLAAVLAACAAAARRPR